MTSTFKKTITGIAMASLAITSVYAAAGDFIFDKVDTDGTTIIQTLVSPIVDDNQIFVWRDGISQMMPYTMGTGLFLNGAVKKLMLDDVPMSIITGLNSTLSAMSTAIGSATSTANTASNSVSTINGQVNVLNSFMNLVNANLVGSSTNLVVGNASSSYAGLVKLTDWNTMTSNVSAAMASVPGLASATSSGLLTSSLWTKLTNFAWSDITGKPDLAVCYEGTTKRTGCFPTFKSVTVGSGVAVFYLTTDGTSGGTAIYPNGVVADSVNAFVSDATASYQMSYAFTNSNKTLTVTANKLTTSNILTGILGQAVANGSVVKLQVYGY